MEFYSFLPIPTLALDQLYTLFGRNDWDIVKTQKLFVLKDLLDKMEQVKSSFGTKKKDNSLYYSGICLQCSSSDKDPYFDQLDLEGDEAEDDFIRSPRPFASDWNKAGLIFKNLIETFETHFTFQRGRILIAEPKMLLNAHKDAPQSATLHIPLTTNPHCHLVIDGREYFLEPDGCAYLVNVGKRHFMYNAGNTSRAHIVFSLPPTGVKKLAPLDTEKFSEFINFKSSQNSPIETTK